MAGQRAVLVTGTSSGIGRAIRLGTTTRLDSSDELGSYRLDQRSAGDGSACLHRVADRSARHRRGRRDHGRIDRVPPCRSRCARDGRRAGPAGTRRHRRVLRLDRQADPGSAALRSAAVHRPGRVPPAGDGTPPLPRHLARLAAVGSPRPRRAGSGAPRPRPVRSGTEPAADRRGRGSTPRTGASTRSPPPSDSSRRRNDAVVDRSAAGLVDRRRPLTCRCCGAAGDPVQRRPRSRGGWPAVLAPRSRRSAPPGCGGRALPAEPAAGLRT